MVTTRNSTKRKSKDEADEADEKKVKAKEEPPSYRSFPNELVLKILKDADRGSLSQCMPVSKQFYEVAGPLLYKKVVIKNRLAEVMLGHQVMKGHGCLQFASSKSRAPVRLKEQLLSFVEHLTIVTHTCGAVEPHFPNVKTLLIMPYADDYTNMDLCQYSRHCRILGVCGQSIQKVVMHNSRANRTFWFNRMALMLSLNHRVLSGLDTGSRRDRLDYWGVKWQHVKQLRIIVSKLPAWLEFTAQRESNSEQIVGIGALARRRLVPVMTPVPVPVTVYLFRDFRQQDDDDFETVKKVLAKDLARADKESLQRAMNQGRSAPPTRKAYTVKTLSDYIPEGLEDEMIWQELKYWREENARRMKRDEGSQKSELD